MTLIVTVAVALTAKLPRVQLTLLVPLQEPCDGTAEPNTTPAGSVSVTRTLVAVAGPLLVTVNR